jgi:predicted nucleotidyltransferase component of viral defense system
MRQLIKLASRRPITAEEKHLWAEMAQLLLLEALSESSGWTSKDLVFHGGTALHLAWSSPRFSEDLDFLMNRDLLATMGDTMRGAVERMQRHILRLDAGIKVELKDKSSPRMGRFTIALSKAGVIGKAIVKSEFWGVNDEYLAQYKVSPRVPIMPESMTVNGMLVRLHCPLPTATLDSIFVDKLVAMANRPYTKWRDIFDLWWISQNHEFARPAEETLAQRVEAYACAYRTDPNSDGEEDSTVGEASVETLGGRLRDYASRINTEEQILLAEEELRRFLVDYTGKTRTSFSIRDVRDMVANAVETAERVASLIDERNDILVEDAPRRRERQTG